MAVCTAKKKHSGRKGDNGRSGGVRVGFLPAQSGFLAGGQGACPWISVILVPALNREKHNSYRRPALEEPKFKFGKLGAA